jgi:hypothetical protein
MSAGNRRGAHHEVANVNFWPGYADALTNVVLNLLFFIALLAIMIAMLGKLVQDQAKSPALTSKAQSRTAISKASVAANPAAGTAIGLPPDKAAPVANLPETTTLVINANEGKEIKGQAGAVAIAPFRQVGLRSVLSLKFEEDAVNPDTSAQKMLLDRYQQMIGGPNGGDVTIWSIADPANPRQTRTAFLRIVALRGVLTAHGAPVEQVHVKILRGFDRPEQLGTLYILFNKKENGS